MAQELKNASFTSKSVDKLPTGAKIIKKSVSLHVEEIENGFIISKSTDIEYQLKDRRDWKYLNKKYYSKDNPLDVSIMEEKSLADNFD